MIGNFHDDDPDHMFDVFTFKLNGCEKLFFLYDEWDRALDTLGRLTGATLRDPILIEKLEDLEDVLGIELSP